MGDDESQWRPALAVIGSLSGPPAGGGAAQTTRSPSRSWKEKPWTASRATAVGFDVGSASTYEMGVTTLMQSLGGSYP